MTHSKRDGSARPAVTEVAAAGAVAMFLTSWLPGFAQQPGWVTLCKGGPFVASKDKQVQSFTSEFNLTAEQLEKPIVLKFENGMFNGRKFKWIRVYLNSGRNASSTAGQKQGGLLVVSEASFNLADRGEAVARIDLTGKLAARNTLLIQGVGEEHSEVSYELQSPTKVNPVVTNIEPSSIAAGSTVTLRGAGFDDVPANNIVSIYGKRVQVKDANSQALTIEVPRGLTPRSYDVEVTVNGVKAAPRPLGVLGAPELESCSASTAGIAPGTAMQISGRNFDPRPGKNIVTFVFLDVKRSVVATAATRDSLTVTVPEFPELAKRAVGACGHLSVVSNGMEANGELSLTLQMAR